MIMSALSPDFLHLQTHLRKRQPENGFILGGNKRRAIFSRDPIPWVLEDHPDLALEREKLLNQCQDLLASENEKYGEMQGNSKTSKSCRQLGMKKGLQGLFGRIIWYELLAQVAKVGDVGTNMQRDSLFPLVFSGDEAVVAELVDAGREKEIAEKIIFEVVGKRLVKCAQHLVNLRASIPSQPTPPVDIQISKVSDKQHRIVSYQLSYRSVQLSISYYHLKKLLRLYRLHTDNNASLYDPIFLRRVFCVIQRYESLSGKSDGYQMAFPNIGFQYLRNNFGVKTECFASPLNCFNSRFCSVAKDTDQFFGSLGNFFLFNGPTGILTEDDPGLAIGGSFEANPPFVQAIMNEMADRIDFLLKKYQGIAPFSFIVIVPAWEDCRGIIDMTNSEFNRPYRGYRLRLEKSKHDYRPGMQHRADIVQQKSNVDSFVFFLQNDLGATRWPVHERHGEELKQLLEQYSLVELNHQLLIQS